MKKSRIYDFLIIMVIIVNVVLATFLINGRKDNQQLETAISLLEKKTNQLESFKKMTIIQKQNDGIEISLDCEIFDMDNNILRLGNINKGSLWILKIFETDCFTCYADQKGV